jgi:dTDP-N-acetylfucosamine:lipid II N-acetylfucosaminyltransferase
VITKEVRPIVHIAIDEKFIDAAYDIYEKAFPGLNLFLILQREADESIKYLKHIEKYSFVNTNTDFVDVSEDYSKDAKIIVFHGMNYFQALLVNNLTKGSKKYVWTPFGAEVYNNNMIFKNESVGPKTNKTFIFSYEKWVKDIFRPVYYALIKGKKNPNCVIKKSFLKMDFTSILYEEELNNYIKLDIIKSNVKHIKFTYYPLDIVINKNMGFVDGTNILLGNSASYTNNHLEAFDILENLDLNYNQIITVLSYGNKEYANNIIDLGYKKFGDRFSVLQEFMPLQEYQKILQGCGTVIMNHHRQQAVGNVMNAVYLGAKVFLSEKNTLFHYLKRIGCHIYSVEHDLNVENKEVFNLLTIQQMNHNRAIVSSELSLDSMVNEMRDKLTPLL